MRLHRRDRNTASYVGVPHHTNLTLTSFVTSRGLIRTGTLISCGFWREGIHKPGFSFQTLTTLVVLTNGCRNETKWSITRGHSLRGLRAFGCPSHFVELRSEPTLVQLPANFLHVCRGDRCRLPAKAGADKGDQPGDIGVGKHLLVGHHRHVVVFEPGKCRREATQHDGNRIVGIVQAEYTVALQCRRDSFLALAVDTVAGATVVGEQLVIFIRMVSAGQAGGGSGVPMRTPMDC